MRVYKAAYCREIMQYKNDVSARKRASRVRKIYICANCKYQSCRRFNVERHRERIHWNVRFNACCGIQFYNKGDYYVHCEQVHPKKKPFTFTSRTKYKIINESFNYQIIDTQITNSCGLQANQQFSNNVINNQERIRELKSNLTLRYLVTFNDFQDLMNFFTDQELNSCLQILPRLKLSSTSVNGTGEESETPMQMFEMSSSMQSVEKKSSKNDVNNYQTELSNSSSTSLKLPTKKLILQRFRNDAVQKRETPFREQNNNCTVQVNSAEKRVEGNPLSVFENRKHSWFNRRNKENIPFSVDREQLNVKLDTAPVATESYRDILGPIDFSGYRIF